MRLAHAHQRARARRAAPAVPPRPARCACPPAHCQQPTRESTPFTPNPPHGLPADHPAHGPRSASRRRPRPPMPCLCPPRACALPTAPPPAHRKPTPAPFTPNPVHTKPRHEAFCHPRLALARRRAGGHPCPCRAHVPAARSLARRPCPRTALRRRAVTARFTARCSPAPRPLAALPALARRCAGARCPPRCDLACRPLSAARSRVARLRGAPALARRCAGVPSQRASQPAAALRRARSLPSLPSHGDAPAPGARPAVTLPAGRCPPPARALHACAAPLPSHGVAPAPGPGTRLPRPSPPPARCPPCLSRIPMGAPQPGEGSPPEDGRPTP